MRHEPRTAPEHDSIPRATAYRTVRGYNLLAYKNIDRLHELWPLQPKVQLKAVVFYRLQINQGPSIIGNG